MEKKKEKAEWKQQYQKRKDYFKQYYQKNKETMDANSRKNAKKYREAYKSFREGKKTELEKRVELLEKVVKALCKGKQDYVRDIRVKIANGSEMRSFRNEFEYQMENIDYNYKD